MNNQNETESISLKGTLVFFTMNPDSKSEGKVPFIYVNKEEIHKVFCKGDNPFENNILNEYDGMVVEAFGHFKSNGTFLIEQIMPLESKLIASNNNSESDSK